MFGSQSSRINELELEKNFNKRTSILKDKEKLSKRMTDFLHPSSLLLQLDKALEPMDDLETEGTIEFEESSEKNEDFCDSKLSAAFNSSAFSEKRAIVKLFKC